MRCPCYSSDDEEPAYYERCGREIFLSGQVKHKLREGLLTEAQAQALLAGYKTVTGSDIDDFEKRRATNLAMLLKLLADNPCDYFVVPQDDSAEYGYTTMDRLAVKKFVADNGLPDVPMYPGADEVGMTLTSRDGLLRQTSAGVLSLDKRACAKRYAAVRRSSRRKNRAGTTCRCRVRGNCRRKRVRHRFVSQLPYGKAGGSVRTARAGLQGA